MPHYRFSADAMTEFSLVASFELYFLLRFSVSVSVYSLGGSTGFDLLNPLPVFINLMTPFSCFGPGQMIAV